MVRQNKVKNGATRKERRKAEKLARRGRGRAAQAGSNNDKLRALLTKALHLRVQGQLDKAEAIYRELLADHDDVMTVHFGLATLLEKLNRSQDAYAHYKIAVSLKPGDYDCWYRFAGCLSALAEFEAAEVAICRAIKIRPGEPSGYIELSRILDNLDETEKALRAVEKALDIDPDDALHHFERGRCQMGLGEFEGARSSFETAARIDPQYTDILYYQRAQMRDRFEDAEDILCELTKTVQASDITSDHRAFVNFTMGRILEKKKEFDAAFECYSKANDTWHANGKFDPEHVMRVIDELIMSFTPEAFEAHKGAGSDSAVPVFILGMPRSGTTLVEQIISSHPRASAAGELKKMGQCARTLWRTRGEDLQYPRDIARISPELMAPFADQYLARLTRDCPQDTLKVTDKLPMNFYQLGLIAILFPKARVIHCRRDPMDTCLSCYLQNFKDALEFANDLTSLGFYYRQYERLMAHWTDVVPSEILEVQYEDVISDQEGMSRKIVEFVGLDWDDACLSFHKSERTVRTASQWQVRQPVYNSSVHRWRIYEKHLAPLQDALARYAL